MFLINYMTSKEDSENLIKIFKSLDINGDGQLSKEELISGNFFILGYRNKEDCLNPEEAVEKIFLECDKNNSGYIDYTGNLFKIEFVAASIDQANVINKKQL